MYEVTSNKSSAQANAVEVETLAAAGQFSVFAIRVWSSAAKQGMPIDHALGRFFNDFRCGPALQLFDECMALLAVSAIRKVEIGCCPSNMYVVADEDILLRCFAALERLLSVQLGRTIGLCLYPVRRQYSLLFGHGLLLQT